MAKRTVIIDDLTGDAGARTRALRFDGVDYEIDLTDAHFGDLRALLKPYLRAARAVPGSAPSGGRPRANGGARPAKTTSDSAAIRAWARSQGMAVTERGRVQTSLREAWVAAGSPQ